MAWYRPSWLDEAASFAIPALTTLAGSALLPGAGGPLAQMLSRRALMAAAGAGAKGLASKEEEDRARDVMKKQEQAQAMTNVANTLSSRGGFQAPTITPQKAGLLETVAKGTSTGLGIAQAAETANMARQKIQQELAKEAQEQATQRGRDLAAAGALEVETRTAGAGARQGIGHALRKAAGVDVGTTGPRSLEYQLGTISKEGIPTLMGEAVTATPAITAGVTEYATEAADKQQALDLAQWTKTYKEAEQKQQLQEWGQKRLERFNDLKQKGVDNVENLGVDAAFNLFRDSARTEFSQLGPLTTEDFTDVLNAMHAADKSGTAALFSATQKSEIANLAAREDAIQRIRVASLNLSEDDFKLLSSMKEELLYDLRQGRYTSSHTRDLLMRIGFTTEQTLRDFSGAAITAEEFDRFSNSFFGSLAGGRDVLMQRMNVLEEEFRNQRVRLVESVTNPIGVTAGIQRADEATLNTLAARGDPAAIAELNRRGIALPKKQLEPTTTTTTATAANTTANAQDEVAIATKLAEVERLKQEREALIVSLMKEHNISREQAVQMEKQLRNWGKI